MYYRRLEDSAAPWTTDPVLASYRFTNTYRAADRVTQYLIREVQYQPDRSQSPNEIFFRTLLFKFFNKIETWEALEEAHGLLTWETVDLNAIDHTLSKLMAQGLRIYSPAYIIPAPPLGATRKHTNHLKLIAAMMEDRVPDRLSQVPDLGSVYHTILNYPGLGHFLAFQFTIDLNYSNLLHFGEGDFVVAGPGALDGISKCFSSTGGLSPEDLIHWITDQQDEQLASRNLPFYGLFGRRLQPIDCQNLFCEVSKYSRVIHPNVSGLSNRRRIKQSFSPSNRAIPAPFFPPRWRLHIQGLRRAERRLVDKEQLVLF